MSEDGAAGLTTREDRVLHIAGMMARGEWMKGRMYRRELAQMWGVTDAAIRAYSSEAHRLVCVDPEEREHLRTTLAMRMHDIADRARVTLNEITGMPDFRAEMDALKLYAEYSGAGGEQSVADGGAREPHTIEIVYPEAPDPTERPASESAPADPPGSEGVPPVG